MRWRVTAGGFVAAVLVVTGACGTSDTTAEQKPESNGTPGATVGDVEWNRVELDMDLEGIVPAGDGFVATRVSDDAGSSRVREVVVTSPDGVTWTDAAETGLAPDESVAWTFGDGGPWGAIGQVFDPDDEWFPSDLLFTPDGTEFVRGSVPADVIGLEGTAGIVTAAVGERGVVALAGTQEAFEGYPGPPGTLGVVALFSEDLETWEQVQSWAEPAGFQPIVASHVGFLAMGTDQSVFFSPDGREWDEVSLPVEWEATPAEGTYVGVMGVAGWRDGFVLVTQQPSMVLTSTDGRSWTPGETEPLPDFAGGGGNTWALGSSLGALVVSVPFEPAQGGAALFSSDGQTWQTWSTDDPFTWPGGPEYTTMGEQAIVLRLENRGQDGPPAGTTLWVGSLNAADA